MSKLRIMLVAAVALSLSFAPATADEEDPPDTGDATISDCAEENTFTYPQASCWATWEGGSTLTVSGTAVSTDEGDGAAHLVVRAMLALRIDDAVIGLTQIVECRGEPIEDGDFSEVECSVDAPGPNILPVDVGIWCWVGGADEGTYACESS